MTKTELNLAVLDGLTLDKGGHVRPEEGACLMEAVSWVAGEEWGDHPSCACPVLGAYGRALNDTLPDDLRQDLVPLVPMLVGSRGDKATEERRGLMAMDWMIRTYTPTWLRLAGLNDEAAALEALPEIVDTRGLEGSLDALNDARRGAAAAWDAVWDAAWDAVWDAARDAARDAAGAAARDAAGAAARVALAPTVTELQRSGIDLFRRMIEAGPHGVAMESVA